MAQLPTRTKIGVIKKEENKMVQVQKRKQERGHQKGGKQNGASAEENKERGNQKGRKQNGANADENKERVIRKEENKMTQVRKREQELGDQKGGKQNCASTEENKNGAIRKENIRMELSTKLYCESYV